MNWMLFALAGSIAQLIDGSLGMGFGLTSSTLLLTLGASAAVASAAVHAAGSARFLAPHSYQISISQVGKFSSLQFYYCLDSYFYIEIFLSKSHKLAS